MKKICLIIIIALGFSSCATTGISPEDITSEPAVFCTVIEEPNPLLIGGWRADVAGISRIGNNPFTNPVEFYLLKVENKYALYFYMSELSGSEITEGWEPARIEGDSIFMELFTSIRMLATFFVMNGEVYTSIRMNKGPSPTKMSRIESLDTRNDNSPVSQITTEKGGKSILASEEQQATSSVLSNYNEVDRDENFILYSNGIVLDTKTNLEWVAGPDKNTPFQDAWRWIKNLSIDGKTDWRLPTEEEMRSLYDKGKGSNNMTPLIKTTGEWVWTSHLYTWTRDIYNRAWNLRKAYLHDRPGIQERLNDFRAFAVRSVDSDISTSDKKPDYYHLLQGKWVGADSSGETGSLIFYKDRVADFIEDGMSANEEMEGRGRIKYILDSSKQPMELDLIFEDNNGNKMMTAKMIIKFLSDDKIKIRTYFSDKRPEKFLEKDDENTTVLYKVK